MEGEGGNFPFSWVRHLENNLFPEIIEPAPSCLAMSPSYLSSHLSLEPFYSMATFQMLAIFRGRMASILL